MAGAMSEIIHYVDSEITAGTAVVKKSGSPKGCGTLSLLPEAAITLARQSQFRSAKAEFHSSRRREFHFAHQSEHPPLQFPIYLPMCLFLLFSYLSNVILVTFIRIHLMSYIDLWSWMNQQVDKAHSPPKFAQT